MVTRQRRPQESSQHADNVATAIGFYAADADIFGASVTELARTSRAELAELVAWRAKR